MSNSDGFRSAYNLNDPTLYTTWKYRAMKGKESEAKHTIDFIFFKSGETVEARDSLKLQGTHWCSLTYTLYQNTLFLYHHLPRSRKLYSNRHFVASFIPILNLGAVAFLIM